MAMTIKHLLISLITLCALIGCVHPGPNNGGGEDNPSKPTIDTKPLAAACDYITGGGEETTGGNGGTIYHVTTLSDEVGEDGTYDVGTLRYAIRQTGARVIIFDVSGVIELKSELSIRNGNVTILGQSAPYGGICIAGYPLVIRDDNVIIRFVHFRMGDLNGVEGDAVSCYNQRNIVLDHCSMSWSTDECVSCYGNHDFTCQYCFITESLNNSVHAKGAHGYGGIWGGSNATFHHNLLAHHGSRNPRFDHDYVTTAAPGPLDYVNNVVYNWGGNSAYGGEGVKEAHKINFVANYYKPGPATNSNVRERLLNPTTKCSNCNHDAPSSVLPGKFYVADNYMFGSAGVTADNWTGVFPDDASKKSQCKASTRHAMGKSIKEETAEQAFETVLTKAGCSFHRDAVDKRIAEEVRKGTSTYSGSNGSKNGLVDTPADVGGWPDYTAGYPKRSDADGNELIDSDLDGIPDSFEEAYGLNPHKNTDARHQTLVAGFSNLEVYLNWLVKDLY